MTEKSKSILSITGGGFPGLFSCLILQELESVRGGNLREGFDLIAGTSVGGIIALGVAAGLPVSQITRIFLRHGAEIFPNSSGMPVYRNLRSLYQSLRKPKHDGKALKRIVEKTFGDMRMRDLDVDVLIPAIRVNDGEPVLFNRRDHSDHLLSEIALATSAAPTFLPARPVDGVLYADGAVFANCPDELALNMAMELGSQIVDIAMVSIGVPRHPITFSDGSRENLGVLDWMGEMRLLGAALKAQESLAERRLMAALGSRYMRIESLAGDADLRRIGLDKATDDAVSALYSMAVHTCQETDWRLAGSLMRKTNDAHHDLSAERRMIALAIGTKVFSALPSEHA